MKNNYFRNFGTISNDSVVTDIYNKKLKKKRKLIGKTKGKECITRMATDEERIKYGII